MIELLIIGVFALIFVSAALAPMEALGWWAGWGKTPKKHEIAVTEAGAVGQEPEADYYLVYLSGIGAISGTSIPAEEYPFIHALEARLGNARVISDIYPYSVTNTGLTVQPIMAGLWKRIERMRSKNADSAPALIVNLRNAFQLFVSADRRYGPIYNLGVAHEIMRGLLRHGYRPHNRKPVVLLGWSGGGQIAIGAVTYLAPMTGDVYVISVGGMLSDDIGLHQVKHLWHLYGEKDQLQALGQKLFTGRWRTKPQSPWNRARRARKIDLIALGPFKHNGQGNYFDMATPPSEEARTYGAKTLDTIEQVLTQADLLKSTDPQPSP